MPFYPPVSSSDVPSAAGLQKRYDYDGSNNLIYEGWAMPGELSSAASWAIVKNTYTGSNLTQSQWCAGNPELVNIWDNRAALTYK